MQKPDKNRWIQQRIKNKQEMYDKETRLIYQQKQRIHQYEADAYMINRKREVANKIAAARVELDNLYENIYNRPAVIEKAIVEIPTIRGIEKYAKTRSKTGNEMFNLNYLVAEKSPRQFERFVKATHGRTLKKMLLNNVKFAQSQGAKNWTTRATKFIKEFKGSKAELAYQVAERYGNKLAQYSGDLSLKNKGGMVRETERLTKSGKIRQRYKKRATSQHVSEIEKVNRYRFKNIESAMYRMFKIDNRGKDFDSQGNGIITQYWLNRIRDFSTIPRAGLGDLEEQFFDSIQPLGQMGGQSIFAVKLSERAIKVLHRMRTQPETSIDQYGKKFIDLYKRKL